MEGAVAFAEKRKPNWTGQVARPRAAPHPLADAGPALAAGSTGSG